VLGLYVACGVGLAAAGVALYDQAVCPDNVCDDELYAGDEPYAESV
jgi:hypothetical protein